MPRLVEVLPAHDGGRLIVSDSGEGERRYNSWRFGSLTRIGGHGDSNPQRTSELSFAVSQTRVCPQARRGLKVRGRHAVSVER
jgi:hypothetical protein